MLMLIRDIRDAGDHDRERVVLQAKTDLEAGAYVLIAARSAASGKALGGPVPFCFWFPDTVVRAGDLLVLYSKPGVTTQKDNAAGGASHFFYWGLEAPIWHADNLRPVLIEAAQWQALAKTTAALEHHEP
nr:hypothetical protein [uncultured Rhodopila sp.]